jgi:hypothetical protein
MMGYVESVTTNLSGISSHADKSRVTNRPELMLDKTVTMRTRTRMVMTTSKNLATATRHLWAAVLEHLQLLKGSVISAMLSKVKMVMVRLMPTI